MGEEVGDKDNDEFEEGLNPEEAVEFLKLVEQARAETPPEEGPLEAPLETDKPKKRFRLKSKGRKKKSDSPDIDKRAANPPSTKRVSDGVVRLAPDVVARSEARAKRTRKSSPAKAKADSRSTEPAERKSRWLEVLLACAVVASLIYLARPSTPTGPTDDKTPVIVPQATEPDTAAVYFLRAVYTERLDEAYGLLSPETQGRLGDQGFRELVGAFLRDNKEILTRVEVDSMKSEGSTAVLSIKTQDTENLWSVELVKQEDFWFVAALRGGSLEI
jgi:hypothetical protein